MLSDVMNYFGLHRVFDRAGYFETEQQTSLFKELKPRDEFWDNTDSP